MGAIFGTFNLDRIRRGHAKVIANTKTAVAAAMAEAGEEAVAYAKRYPRYTPRTGKLSAGNEWRTVRVAGGRVLRIQNKVKYAAPIDKGARPHDIHARRSPYLHFLGKRGWVRARRVKHPGNKPYRFLYGATVIAGRSLGVKLQKRMSEIARAF